MSEIPEDVMERAREWTGPFKGDAAGALDSLRRSVAELIGENPDTWPTHKNAPLAIAAAVAILVRDAQDAALVPAALSAQPVQPVVKMRTGDHVLHRPSQETWVVAWADYETGYMAPCGWPTCQARIDDCDIVKDATDEESAQIVAALAISGRTDAHKATQIADRSVSATPPASAGPEPQGEATRLQPVASPVQGYRDQIATLAAEVEALRRERDELDLLYKAASDLGENNHRMASRRADSLDAVLAQCREALRPFADIAGEAWADENGWTDAACQNDRIRDWLGPSAFFAARTALKGASHEPTI
ncbi:MAG: hypothetical protein KF810_17075 [Rhizobiaceae bacterium]|nr:hypothetical protein [Rhizobiaceae bacterium]